MSSIIQRTFASGEIAPSIQSRVDAVRYQTGLKACRNWMVRKDGGLDNRPGTEFIGEVSNSGKRVRLIPFVFNADQTYVLEFGDLYFRIIKNGSYIYTGGLSIEGITQASEAVVTITGHTFSNDDEIVIEDVLGMTELNFRHFKVANVTANTFKIKYMPDSLGNSAYVDSTGFGAWTSGGIAQPLVDFTTTYVEADLQDLKYVQSADVITIVHPSYPPREVARLADDSWTITDITFAPGIAAPGGLGVTNVGAPGAVTYNYKITSIASETYEESLGSSTATTATGNATLSATNYNQITWGAVSGAVEYNVYKASNGVYGFIGTAIGTSFNDIGISADTTETPPTARNPFGSSDNYPAAVAYYQQRLVFGNTNNDPEKIWTSRSGLFHNFTISSPLQDDDAVTFSLAGRQVNSVQDLVELRRLLVFTSGGEWSIEGNDAGIISPADINPKQYSYNGSSGLSPLIIDGSAIYNQARGSVIRDIAFDYQVDGYRGNDLTIFSSHLFKNKTLTDWAYQQTPNSTVWIVRSDGVLLGLTYVKEQQIIGWHRHDFDGVVENVCVVPEGDEDFLYLVIKREIDGDDNRYVERLSTRNFVNIEDVKILDCTSTYDGRAEVVAEGEVLQLQDGTDWDIDETITLYNSGGIFDSSLVGRVYILTLDDEVIRFTVGAYVSATELTGSVNRTVPASMQNTDISDWMLGATTVSGLWSLEGKSVSVFADGYVVANPNNSAYDEIMVEDGVATLDQAYGVIHVGLPITADIETLDIDTPNGETVSDKAKLVTKVNLSLLQTRGLFVGLEEPDSDDSQEGLYELKIRENEGYDESVDLVTDKVDVNVEPNWNRNGRIFIRQTDPVPASIIAITPAGLVPFKGDR